jgi:hypothetical protein
MLLDEVLVICGDDDVVEETDPLMMPNLPLGVHTHGISGSSNGQSARK